MQASIEFQTVFSFFRTSRQFATALPIACNTDKNENLPKLCLRATVVRVLSEQNISELGQNCTEILTPLQPLARLWALSGTKALSSVTPFELEVKATDTNVECLF